MSARDVVTIAFTQPDAMLTLNQRLHWAPKAARTRSWRTAAYVAALQAIDTQQIDIPLPMSIVAVSLPVHSLDVRRDPANLYPTIKAAIDGLVDAEIFVDDDGEHVATVEPSFTKGGDVVVTITPLQPLTSAAGA